MDFFLSNNLSEVRPAWARRDEMMADYYDHYWCVPLHNDRDLFEMLTLEVFQAGLAWRTIWSRREAFRQAFANYDVYTVAAFSTNDFIRLVNDQSIIRNRAKILAAINNARAICKVTEDGQSFAAYLWGQIDGEIIRVIPDEEGKLPRTIPVAERLAKTMTQDGFSRIGPVTAFSFMCAVGMVDGRVYKKPTQLSEG